MRYRIVYMKKPYYSFSPIPPQPGESRHFDYRIDKKVGIWWIGLAYAPSPEKAKAWINQIAKEDQRRKEGDKVMEIVHA